MAAVCRAYASHAEALDAVNAVLGAGIPGEGVRVLTGEPQRDARDEPVGEFAGTNPPGAPVGDFGGGTHPEGHERGHFAGGDQREGSFADTDREEVITYPGGVEHARVASHHKVKKVLTDAGLDEGAAERDEAALHAGQVLVLVNVPDDDVDRVVPLLGG